LRRVARDRSAARISCQRLFWLEPMTIWVIWCCLAKSAIASAGSGWRLVPMRSQSWPRVFNDSNRLVPHRRGVAELTWSTLSSPLAEMHPGGAPEQHIGPGAPVTAPGSALSSRTAGSLCAGGGAREAPRRLVGQVTQRQLAQAIRLSVWKKCARHKDFVGRVDVAVQHPPAELLGRRVHQLGLVGLAHHQSGTRSRTFARSSVRRRRQALDVLDVERGDDVYPGVEKLEHVSQRLAWRPHPDIGVASSSTRALGRRASTRRGPSPRTWPPVFDRDSGNYLEASRRPRSEAVYGFRRSPRRRPCRAHADAFLR